MLLGSIRSADKAKTNQWYYPPLILIAVGFFERPVLSYVEVSQKSYEKPLAKRYYLKCLSVAILKHVCNTQAIVLALNGIAQYM